MVANQNKTSEYPHIQATSKDIQHMKELIKMFNITSFDQNVPHILLEFAFNSISKNIEDCMHYMRLNSNKNPVHDIPVKLLSYTSKQNYKQKIYLKTLNNSMAIRKNKQPLPVPNEHNPMCYPSEDDCLINSSIVFASTEKDSATLTLPDSSSGQSSNGSSMPALKLIPSNNDNNSTS